MTNETADFHRLATFEDGTPTLVEGFPGIGLVASIAVDLMTRQLEMTHYGNVRSAALPPVASFEDGRVRNAVRVYRRTDPDVMTLQSDIALPTNAARALSDCVLNDLVEEFDRAVFLVGAPAESEQQVGEVVGVATDDDVEADLRAAGVELAEGSGLIGGVSGALVDDCYRAGVPAAVLVVRANPYVPDPAAAKALIEDALEPLVDFDVDTTELEEEAEEIETQLENLARQFQAAQASEQSDQQSKTPRPSFPSMYQ